MSKPPEMPAGVLLQSLTADAEGETSGYRVYTDGRYETKAGQAGWLAAEPLSSKQVEAIARAVADSRPAELHSRYVPTRRASDAHALWMQLEHAGRHYHIEIVGDCDVPAIRSLSRSVVDTFRSGR